MTCSYSQDSFVFYEKCMNNGPALSIYHDGRKFFGHCFGDWWFCDYVRIYMHKEGKWNKIDQIIK